MQTPPTPPAPPSEAAQPAKRPNWSIIGLGAVIFVAALIIANAQGGSTQASVPSTVTSTYTQTEYVHITDTSTVTAPPDSSGGDTGGNSGGVQTTSVTGATQHACDLIDQTLTRPVNSSSWNTILGKADYLYGNVNLDLTDLIDKAYWTLDNGRALELVKQAQNMCTRMGA